jgi:hypothetical protein
LEKLLNPERRETASLQRNDFAGEEEKFVSTAYFFFIFLLKHTANQKALVHKERKPESCYNPLCWFLHKIEHKMNK